MQGFTQGQSQDGARMRSTRRGFMAGLAAGGAARLAGGPLLTGSAHAATVQPCRPSLPGVRTSALALVPGGRSAWTADGAARTITAHRLSGLQRGRSIDVGGAPVHIAISPDGARALVATAFYDHPGVALVSLAAGQADHVDAGPAPRAIAIHAGGRQAWVLGGEAEGTLRALDVRSGAVGPAHHVGSHPRSIALLPDGKHALVALNGEAAVAVVALPSGKVTRRIKTRAFPSQITVSPDGTRALVTHDGYGERHVTPLDLEHWRAHRTLSSGAGPAAIAYNRAGTVAAVANADAGTVSILDAHTGRRRRVVRVGGTPRAIAITGSRAIVADGLTGLLRSIRLNGGK